MSDKPFNPPAFPCEAHADRTVQPGHDYLHTGIHSATFPGMTLRDYFAGQSLTGYLAGRDCSISFEEAAVEAYSYADAMLTARESTS